MAMTSGSIVEDLDVVEDIGAGHVDSYLAQADTRGKKRCQSSLLYAVPWLAGRHRRAHLHASLHGGKRLFPPAKYKHSKLPEGSLIDPAL